MCIHIYLSIYLSLSLYIYIYIYMHISLSLSIYIYIYIYIYIQSCNPAGLPGPRLPILLLRRQRYQQRVDEDQHPANIYIYLSICICLSPYIYIYIYIIIKCVHIYVYIYYYTSIYSSSYLSLPLSLYIYIYIYTLYPAKEASRAKIGISCWTGSVGFWLRGGQACPGFFGRPGKTHASRRISLCRLKGNTWLKRLAASCRTSSRTAPRTGPLSSWRVSVQCFSILPCQTDIIMRHLALIPPLQSRDRMSHIPRAGVRVMPHI